MNAIIVGKKECPNLYKQLMERGLFSHPATDQGLDYMYVVPNGELINKLCNRIEALERKLIL